MNKYKIFILSIDLNCMVGSRHSIIEKLLHDLVIFLILRFFFKLGTIKNLPELLINSEHELNFLVVIKQI